MEVKVSEDGSYSTYMLRVGKYQSVFFDTFKTGDTSVELYVGGYIVAVLHFEQANEFYKAWRTYQCSI